MSIAGASASVRDTVTIGLPDSAARLRAPQSGTVVVEIVPAPIERTLDGVAVEPRGLGRRRRVSVTPPRVSVVVQGTPRTVEALDRGDVDVYADLTGLAPGRYNLPVKYEAPPGVTVLRVEPATLGVVVR